MIAEKFQPLIAAGAVACALERGNVGQRALEQRGIGEAVADAVFQRAGAAAPALRFLVAVKLRRRPRSRAIDCPSTARTLA